MSLPNSFLRKETGAMTVDWVVLCAAVTGMILFMESQYDDYMRKMSDDVAEELTNSEIVSNGAQNAVGYTFADGAGRWSGGSVADIPGFGEVLGPIGGSGGREALTHDFIARSDVDLVAIEFELLSLDSLDDESGIIFINGIEIGRVTGNHDGSTFHFADDLEERGIYVEFTAIVNNQHIGGFRDDRNASNEQVWRDDITRVRIGIANPSDAISFGFGSDADQDTNDEGFAIDNFVITGVSNDDYEGQDDDISTGFVPSG